MLKMPCSYSVRLLNNSRPTCTLLLNNSRPTCTLLLNNSRPTCTLLLNNSRPTCTFSFIRIHENYAYARGDVELFTVKMYNAMSVICQLCF